jgi:hypothetical protein
MLHDPRVHRHRGSGRRVDRSSRPELADLDDGFRGGQRLGREPWTLLPEQQDAALWEAERLDRDTAGDVVDRDDGEVALPRPVDEPGDIRSDCSMRNGSSSTVPLVVTGSA